MASSRPAVDSVAENGRDPLVKLEDAGVVEEHVAAVGDDPLDHLVHGVVQGRRPAMAVGEQAVALEPTRGGGRFWWLWLFVCLKVELLYAFGLLNPFWA